LPEALNNFIACWDGVRRGSGNFIDGADDPVVFSDRLHSAPAVFDEVKLSWVNATHLRALDNVELWKRVEPFLLEAKLVCRKIPHGVICLNAFKTSMNTLKDAVELFRP